MKMKDLTGQRFERLTVLEQAEPYISPSDGKRSTTWRCRCDCGNEVVVLGRNLVTGGTRSCGCLRRETSAMNGKLRRGARYGRGRFA